jgi:peptide/nickel transport system permease protein
MTHVRSGLRLLHVLFRVQPFAAVVVAIFVLAAALGPVVAPSNPNDIDPLNQLAGASWDHLLGTDEYGRDIFSRILTGARIALLVALASVSIALLLGTPLGLMLGFYDRSRGEFIASRFVDALLAFPAILLAMALGAALEPSLKTATISIGLVGVPVFARVARSAALAVRNQEYTVATRALGARDRYVLTRTVAGNALPAIIVQASLFAADAVMFESALSFLGLGAEVPTASWGSMLNGAKMWMNELPLYAISVGAVVAVTILSLNLLGDGIRVAVDPKLRRSYEIRRRRLPAAAAPSAPGVPPTVSFGERAAARSDSPAGELSSQSGGQPTPVLSVRDLAVRFSTMRGEFYAVRNVGFSIDPGETLGLVGESGCGKTVTALAVMGLLPARVASVEGTIEFRGQPVPYGSSRAMRRIRGNNMAMVFQNPVAALNPLMKVGDQLAEVLKTHLGLDDGAARERSVELLESVRIPAARRRRDNYPHEFSGGMCQRVMIAMALACDPDLVIADEPTTALDVTTQAQILELLRDLCGEHGASVLLITHDLGVVAGFCDRVAVLYAGAVVENGTTERLFENPLHPYTERLLRSVPQINDARSRAFEQIQGAPPDLATLPPGCPFAPRCSHAFARCAEEPPLREIADDQAAACWWTFDRTLETTRA